ncbi:hypothetical protein HOY82DRAFT_597179 [Tuber indicum]|nr:hypothetical protein HOY82DRAFT_597179 [Tuber indicum]
MSLDIICENIAWECWLTLTETIGDKESHQIRAHEELFPPTDLYRLLTVGDGFYTDSSDERYIYLGSTSSSLNRRSDAFGLLCDNAFFPSENETVWNGYRLWVAGIVARALVVAIMHENTKLPQFARGPHPDQTSGTAYLHTTLEVDWFRVALKAISITGGQILAILIVLSYCNGVCTRDDSHLAILIVLSYCNGVCTRDDSHLAILIVLSYCNGVCTRDDSHLAILIVLSYCNGVCTRDDSHLATAELLKTIITKFDDGKLMTGEELAASLDDVLGAPVSYGTRKGKDGGPPEVDLASGLDAIFPPFPR